MLREASIVAIFAVFLYLFYTCTRQKQLYLFKKHHPGECRRVTGIEYGSENMEVSEDGLAFITSGTDFAPLPDGYHEYIKKNNVKGQIFIFDFLKPELNARPLKFRPSKAFNPETFQPHGISMLEDKDKGEHLIYVVNHVRGDLDRIEKFRFVPGVNELEHLNFFNNTAFHILNDLALTGEDQFYVSNYLYFHSHQLAAYEWNYPLALGGVLYVDEKGATEVVKKLSCPNGVSLSKDKRLVYVALPIEGVMVYERQKDNGLKLVQQVSEVATVADNFQLTPSGDALVVGAHPFHSQLAAHVNDPTNKAPSSVLHLPLSNGRVVAEEITELFYDHGDLISASTVAHLRNEQLLIGSIINKLVVCDMRGKATHKEGGKK